METLRSAKKITLATLKSFARRNEKNLYYKVTSSFSGMTDCVEDCDMGWEKSGLTTDSYFQSGIFGVYTVGSSRDYLRIYEDEKFFGINVYNCCGTSILAIKK